MRLSAYALALLTIAGSAGAQSGPAQATRLGANAWVAPAPAIAAEVVPRVPSHLVRELSSPSASVRADALHTVVTLAFDTPGGLDLRPAVPQLLSVFRSEPDWRLRIMALRALEAAGGGHSADETVMEALRAEAGPESQRAPAPAVRRLLFATLVGHYGLDALRGDADVAALVRSLPQSSRQ